MSSSDRSTVSLKDAFRRANELYGKGYLADAERWFKSILAAFPVHFESLHMLAIVKAQRGAMDEALALIDRAIAVNPQSAKAHGNRAAMLRALERRAEALESCERAIAADPAFVDAYRNRAAILKDGGRYVEALDSCDQALALEPGSAEVLNIRGAILQDLGRNGEALANFDRALALRPEFAEALSNRGGVHNTFKNHQRALADCDRALAIHPRLADAHYNRGLALSGLDRHADAEASYRQALAINPAFPQALLSRAGALGNLRRHREAADDLERALALDGKLDFAKGMLLEARMHCCDWRGFDALRAEVIDAVRDGRRAADPLAFLAISDSPKDQLACARTWIDSWHPPIGNPKPRAIRSPHERIHVAYLSGDFRDHAVASLCAGLFEHHDRARFETTAVSFGPDDNGAMRARLTRAFDRFEDVRQRSDVEIANLFRDLDVDIAVDLGGLTGSARTGILALRPAPIQVNFLGFTGTMGAPYVDYIVADRTVIAEGEGEHYAESVVYLPGSFQVNDSRRAAPQSSATRRAVGLPDDAFVFCCFNNAFKISPSTFAAWMRVLKRVDASVLWLLQGNPDVMVNLRREAEAAGVAPERLVFAPKASPAEHIGRHRLADLFLDTLPFNAHTTASDALWAGLPVLTCAGTTFAGRVAASLLRAVSLPELVASSAEAYEAMAVRLATSAGELAALKAKLQANRATSPLFDTDRFRRHIETAYTTMYERARRGDQPASFAVDD